MCMCTQLKLNNDYVSNVNIKLIIIITPKFYCVGRISSFLLWVLNVLYNINNITSDNVNTKGKSNVGDWQTEQSAVTHDSGAAWWLEWRRYSTILMDKMKYSILIVQVLVKSINA